MKKKPASRSAFLNPRVLISFAFCAIAVLLALVQSTLTAAILIAAIHVFGDHLGLPREMVSALAVVLCALPGIALYRVSTSISRGMKVMKSLLTTNTALSLATGFINPSRQFNVCQ